MSSAYITIRDDDLYAIRESGAPGFLAIDCAPGLTVNLHADVVRRLLALGPAVLAAIDAQTGSDSVEGL